MECLLVDTSGSRLLLEKGSVCLQAATPSTNAKFSKVRERHVSDCRGLLRSASGEHLLQAEDARRYCSSMFLWAPALYCYGTVVVGKSCPSISMSAGEIFGG